MKIYKGNPEIMATSYMLARSHSWWPDTNPTVSGVPGTKGLQNNRSDAWSQGPNGGPPPGLGTTYNQHDPYVVRYVEQDIRHTANVPSIHYNGPVPESNKDAMLKYADQLKPLRDKYLQEWLASTSAVQRAQLTAHQSAKWRYDRDDTTPWSRNGSRDYPM